jgi:hypothetical protein
MQLDYCLTEEDYARLTWYFIKNDPEFHKE